MSKIICDVCGTAYPETSSQCPICGCAKPDDAQVSVADTTKSNSTGSSSYTYVKGGRFSKANVRKRNQGNPPVHGQREEPLIEEEIPNKKKSNTVLVVIIIILLLAIAATVFYIAARFFLPDWSGTSINTPTVTDPLPTATTIPTTEAPNYACTDLILSDAVLEITNANAAYLLNVTPVPEDTVDVITYESSDPAVATVTSEGRITAVAPGQAIITVTCGEITKECKVVCMFETEPTQPPTEATTAPTLPNVTLELNRTDITLAFRGDSWQLYEGPLSKQDITWTSDNPNVATIEDGLVTAVGVGTTEVHAEYNGQTVTCIIRCSFA